MAEFQEVIKQFKRLCDSANQDCVSCGLGNMFCGMKDIVDNSVEFEKRVISWAAEHPEPVYPTWGEYLASIGVMKPAQPDKAYEVWFTQLYSTNISADIAQKLEIEPKEG